MDGSDQLGERQADLSGLIIAGKYQVLGFLAKGGGGSIYRAQHLQIGREVVLKILRSSAEMFESDPQFATRFRREASTYGKLRHPNTVTLFDYGEHEHGGATLYFMALEYVRGQTLRQVLRQQGALSPDRALGVTQEVLRSLREAHNLGIVHRDLKPSNVMVVDTEEGERIKVLDFGVAKVELQQGATPDDLTRTGTVIGSPHYMAPEQVRTLKVDGRADIYALGCILFEMLTGTPPYGGDGVIEICAAHLIKPVPTMASRGKLELSAELEAIVAKCLQKAPEDRFQSADDMLCALKTLRQGADPVSIERSFHSLHVPSQPPQPPPPARWQPAVWVAVGVLVAAVPTLIAAGVLLLGMFWWRPQEAAPDPVTSAPAEEGALAPAPGEPAEAAPSWQVTSRPPGAEVFSGAQKLGVTPLELQELPAGPLTLKLAGHRPFELSREELQSSPLTTVTLTRVATPAPRPPPQPSPEPFKPDVRTTR
jgi:serine/threonine protein kinase